MEESKDFKMPLSDEQLEKIGGGTGQDADCGVQHGQFPQIGKCCSRVNNDSGTTYKKDCECCTIWAPPPVGANLVVSHFFECAIHGYRKRIRE